MTNPNDPCYVDKRVDVIVPQDLNGLFHDHPELYNRIREYVSACNGLTKREYFAAMAMQGLASTTNSLPKELASSAKNLFSMAAVELADALIATLNKSNE